MEKSVLSGMSASCAAFGDLFDFMASDGRILKYRKRLPDGVSRASVVIVHGMAEHSLRYSAFAETLAADGFGVWALDLRGHGGSLTEGVKGYFADKDGWGRIAADVAEFAGMARCATPSVPAVVFGHSMGSYLARTVIADYPDAFDAAVLSGTGYAGPLVKLAGRTIAAAEVRRIGAKTPSVLMNMLSFGAFNRRFAAGVSDPTGFEWLSRDRENVTRYLSDPLCAFCCTAGFFRDFLGGMSYCCGKKAASKVNKSLPLFFVSGTDDPVGGYSKGVLKSAEIYRRAGVRDVTVKLVREGRHELLNDFGRDEITRCVSEWIGKSAASLATGEVRPV